MDYLKFVEHHRETDADITLGCLPCNDERAQDFGLMKIDEEGNVIVRPLCSCTNPPARLAHIILFILHSVSRCLLPYPG